MVPAALLRAIDQFNRGEYFEQHETLEALWREERGPVRQFYQGVLQIGVGLHHLQRANLTGARRLMARGLAAIEPFQPECLTVDVTDLCGTIRAVLDTLELLNPQSLSTFDWTRAPRIRRIAV
jgi:hypothetical protein